MVDRFLVPTLVLQEIGIVVVNLGIVGQSLNSRPKMNKFLKSNKEYHCQIPLCFTQFHEPAFEMSIVF